MNDEWSSHSTLHDSLSVAIIGDGMAGLICARTLTEQRFAVQVFDKGREPGGRIATRQIAGYQFDDGAQYFTVRDSRFQREVDARVADVHREGKRWRLLATTAEDLGDYDMVVVAVPAPRAVALLDEAPSLAGRIASVKISGCWAVMLAFEQPLTL